MKGQGMAVCGPGLDAAPPRVLVVCCDGTWNDPADRTNVWRTFELLRRHCGAAAVAPDERTGSAEFPASLAFESVGGRRVAIPLVAFYDKGVGEVRGGAFGVGLGVNVQQAYAFIARNWEPGARLFVFGFSRGAYTARSLAGMLNAAGVVVAEAGALGEAWQHYRASRAERNASVARIVALQQTGAALHTPVRFLGVWDTVGSLGVPILSLRRAFDQWLGHRYRFHNTGLGRNVIHANQALAIHERRGAFKPVLWTRRYNTVKDEAGDDTPQHMLQVWFSGSHADVGGGYAGDRGLADIALDWMLRRAVEAGLPLAPTAWLETADDSGAVVCEPNPFAARNVSSTGVWQAVAGQTKGVFDYVVDQLPLALRAPINGLRRIAQIPDLDRAIGGEIPTDDGQFVVGLGERLHASVTERYRGDHAPASVRTALAADLSVFHERGDRREPCATGSRVMIDDDEAVLVDRSTSGIGVAEVGWLQPNTRCRVALDGERWGARVAWTQGDRAGLALLHRLRRPEGRPAELA